MTRGIVAGGQFRDERGGFGSANEFDMAVTVEDVHSSPVIGQWLVGENDVGCD